MSNKKLLIKMILGIAMIFATRFFVGASLMFIEVNGSSMEPTLKDGQNGVAFTLNLEKLERGDIIVLVKDGGYIVKRVIGLPGETVRCKNNQIYINGLPIEDEFAELTDGFREITLGYDEIFVLGDNRIKSFDSRHYGPFKLSQVVAKKAFFF